MTDLELSITMADRVLLRAENGVATFRLTSAAEDPHVIRALYHWRSIAYQVPALLEENARLRAEIAAFNLRTTDYMNV